MVANSHSMQVFLKTERTEQELIALLGKLLGFLVESINVSVENAIGFVQVSSYTQGFKQGVLVTWPRDLRQQRLRTNEIAKEIAVRLRVSVLVEPDEFGANWLLAQPNGSLTSTTVIYLDDGIEVESQRASLESRHIPGK